MLANMACSLIEHKRINTTVAKAKALKQFVEPLITKSKAENNVSADKGTHNRRIVFKNLRDKSAVTELFSTVAEKVGDRPGGYTRIIKLGNRMGDNAEMAMIELVDFNELYNAGKPKKKKSTRRGGGKKGGDASEKATEAKKEEKAASKAEAKAKAEDKAKAKAEDKAAAKAEVKTEEKPEKKAEAPAGDQKEEKPEVAADSQAEPEAKAEEDSEADTKKTSEDDDGAK